MVIFYKKEKVQWNSIDKKQNGVKYSKNDKSSTLPRWMAIKNVQLMQECCNHKGTANIKTDKDTKEEGRQRRVNMENVQTAWNKSEKPN